MTNHFFSDKQLEVIAEQLLNQISEMKSDRTEIPVGISNRHIHLSQDDAEVLFGKGCRLTIKKYLSQPGQFSAEQTVTIVGSKGCVHNVRVLGPVRPVSQLEISRTDSFQLGIKAPVNESGNLLNAGSALIVGPKGSVQLNQNVIIAQRHIHMTPQQAKYFGVKHGEAVSVKTAGERALIFANTLIRVDENYRLECHLDMDEANAAGLNSTNAFVKIIKEI